MVEVVVVVVVGGLQKEKYSTSNYLYLAVTNALGLHESHVTPSW